MAIRALTATLGILAAVSMAAAQGWTPQKNVEIVVGSAPGGINDRTARVMEKVLSERKLTSATLTIVNRAGGGGNLASSYVHQRTGDPHYLLVGTTALASSQIVGSSKLGHGDFTPIASLLSDYLVFVVNAASPVRTGKELAERMRKDAQSVTTGFANAMGNHNHVAAGMLLKAMGGNARDVKVVVFKGSAEAIAALLGGHIDVIPTAAGNAAPHIASGKLRGIAVTAPQRLAGGLAGIPTWKEQGIDLISGGWRGILAPKDITPMQAGYWEGVLRKMSETPEWKAYLERNHSADEFQTGETFRAYLDREFAATKAVLADLGLAR
jgi:putative tricarboxylic transport membrane protein